MHSTMLLSCGTRSTRISRGPGSDRSKRGSAWSVGNSLASDINPALRIGMRAIWIDAPVWEYERRDSQMGNRYVVIAPDLSSAIRTLLQNSGGVHRANVVRVSGREGATIEPK